MGSVKLVVGLDKAILKLTSNFLARLEPLDKGYYQGYSLKNKYKKMS